jgi:hypothetical protein
MFAAPKRERCWSALARVVANGPGPLAMIDAVAGELDGESDAPLDALHGIADLMPAAANMNAAYFARLVVTPNRCRNARAARTW